MLDVLPELGVGQRPVHQAGDQLSAYGDGLVALGLDGLVPELLGVQSVEGIGNGQLRLNGGAVIAHVAHVGGAAGGGHRLIVLAQLLEQLHGGLLQHGDPDHVGEVLEALGKGHVAVQRQAGALGAVADGLVHLLQLALGVGADLQTDHRLGGQDVGEHTALGDDAVHMDVGGEALPAGVDQVQELPGAGQGAVPLPGAGHRVGGQAGELDDVVAQAEHVHVGHALAAAPAVDHQGQGQAVKGPLGRHGHLGPGLLLGGRAVDVDLALELVLQLGHGQRGQHRHGAVGVVPAAVADPGQGVVLHQDAHRGAVPVVQHPPEGGGVAQIGVLHLIAGLAQDVHDLLAGAELLVGDLGVGVQVVAQVHRRLLVLAHRLGNERL